jgi:Protein kinase domain
VSARGRDLANGAMIGGYRIDDRISQGGMGVVYRATNVALGRTYALKVLLPEFATDEMFRERFKREIRIAASLHHPNVVPIHYAGEQDGMLFLAMDLVEGANLREVIVRDGAIEARRAVGLLEQIANALDAAHSKGLVHRDVKPANILIDVQEGREHVYLTDFGLAKRFDNATALLTVEGAVVGTVDYMPPEQITGNHADARSDVYAAGCVFYQMLTGKVPYKREHSVATLFAHVYDPPPALEGAVAASHPTLGPVVAKAMAKDPGDRYLSAGDLARDAVAALTGTRFMGPPTIVGVGDARPDDSSDAGAEQRAQAALAAMETTLQQTEGAATEAGEAGRPTTMRPVPQDPAAPTTPAAPADPTVAAPVSNAQTIKRRVVSAEAAEAAQAPAAPTEAAAGATPTVAAGATAPPTAAAPAPPGGGSPGRRRWWIAALGALVLVGAVVGIVAGSGGSSKKPSTATVTTTQPVEQGEPFGATLDPVPDNNVTGNGDATVKVNGDVLTVTVNAQGLLNGAPHAMHIHAGGRGICPPASAGQLHNGHIAISTTNGIPFYGDVVVALTTTGDTTPRSLIAFGRYPTTGTIRYQRKITVEPSVAALIRRENAVVIVHGIDYNHNGVYDNVLDRSDLSNSLPGEATAPALCGPLAPRPTTSASSNPNGAVVLTASFQVSDVSNDPTMYWCSPPLSARGAGAPV